MKRTTSGGKPTKRKARARTGSRPAARRRGAAKAASHAGRPKARAASPRARAVAARRDGKGQLVQPIDLERQLADPVEAAQEDLRALPERPLFDRDDIGRDDDLAEMLGEEYVRSVTSGEEQGVELRDEPVPEDEGGPFVETGGSKEFGHTPDDAEPEPLPLANRQKSRLLR